MTRRVLAVLGACLLAAATGCVSAGSLFSGQMEQVTVQKSGRWFENNRIAIIDVDGVIGRQRNFLHNGTTVADVKEKLKRVREDGGVRAVILRINSPGGDVWSSDTIHHEVRRFKQETGLPVVAAISGLGASGGFYVALSADRIIASPAALTGSIGVIAEFIDAQGLLQKIGVQSTVIKTGEKKDMGSPMREMTPEERQLMQHDIESFFRRFVATVRAGRPGCTEADVQAFSDGRVLTAQQALDLHLIDSIGYLDDAIDAAKQMAHITHADVVLYRPFPSYTSNIYSVAEEPALTGLQAALGAVGEMTDPGRPTFLYLYEP
jgi:protease-4